MRHEIHRVVTEDRDLLHNGLNGGVAEVGLDVAEALEHRFHGGYGWELRRMVGPVVAPQQFAADSDGP